MKKTVSLLSNLLLSSTLFWGVPAVEANELVETEVVDLAGYCHMKFAPMDEATLSWGRPRVEYFRADTVVRLVLEALIGVPTASPHRAFGAVWKVRAAVP